jgi:hypothetical protein
MSRRFSQQMFRATGSLRTPSGYNAGEGGVKLDKGFIPRDPRPESKKLMKEIRKDPELYVSQTRGSVFSLRLSWC